MLQLNNLCAALLVIGLGASLLEGFPMYCEDNSECPQDHCCLAVGEESICAELQASGEICELDALQNTTDSSDWQQITPMYSGVCPCAAGLTCSSAVSSSEESGVNPTSQVFGVCKKDDSFNCFGRLC